MSSPSQGSPKVTVRQVVEVAATFYGVPAETILGRCVKRRSSAPRLRAMWAAKTLRPDLSFPQVGRVFGRHHTTVLLAKRAIDELRDADPEERFSTDALLGFCRAANAARVAAQAMEPAVVQLVAIGNALREADFLPEAREISNAAQAVATVFKSLECKLEANARAGHS